MGASPFLFRTGRRSETSYPCRKAATTVPFQSVIIKLLRGVSMKRYRLRWLFVVLTLIVLAQTGCQEQAKVPDIAKAEVATEPQKAQITEGSPRITFDKTVHDFGEVAAGKKYTGEFKFTNTGSGVLKITDVKRCCGTLTTLSKEELAPGESSMLTVVYNSGRGSGLMNRHLQVSSNDETNPEVALTIKARVVPKVDYEPQRINLVLDKENAGCPNITLTSLDKKPFSVKAFQSNGESITADVDPSVEATKFVLHPKVDLGKLAKRPAGFVAISLTHPELDTVTIYFSTLARFQITPASIILFNPKPQKPTVKKISVVSNYDEEFEIESTSSEKGLAKVLSQQKVNKGYQFDVEVTPPPPDQTGRFSDVVNVQLKDGEKLSIKCYGRYAEIEE